VGMGLDYHGINGSGKHISMGMGMGMGGMGMTFRPIFGNSTGMGVSFIHSV